jgi:hypothetical protein
VITRSGAGARMSAGVRFGDVIFLAGTVASPDYLVEIAVVAAA